MEHSFWKERWEQNQIGFHSVEIHRFLKEEFPKFELELGSRVLVPMCGKSNDMLWLLEQGYQVVGVELSQIAVDAFFSENKLVPKVSKKGQFVIYEMEKLKIICGDFFTLSASELGDVNAVYDRASIVALPETMRNDYAAKISSFLKKDAKILLVTFEYPQTEMSGPPFCVSQEEVVRLYQNWAELKLLVNENILEKDQKLKSRGISKLNEMAFKLVVK